MQPHVYVLAFRTNFDAYHKYGKRGEGRMVSWWQFHLVSCHQCYLDMGYSAK